MNQNLWGEIDISHWMETPHIKNRLATEQDVKNGLAVFYIQESSEEHLPLDIEIPSLAYQLDDETGKYILVVIIQGERVFNDKIVGLRYFNGGNGVCKLSELLLTDIDLHTT